MTVKKRMIEFLSYIGKGQLDFEQTVGLSRGFVNKIGDSIRVKSMDKIKSIYPELNTTWLLTGEGGMIKSSNNPTINTSQAAKLVPLLPISAQAGSLNDFVQSIKDEDCEKIISPIMEATFAITISGDSMAPEYPSGSQVLIKKIDDKAFIEWGRVYVLDTCNGIVIKKLAPSEKEDYLKCLSINPRPEYAAFDVYRGDIQGIYRVLLNMSIK